MPRYDDPRIGYFHTQTNDMTSIDQINYKDMIHRWNLVKKDPSKKISEPIKPITWWIENTTPYEFRDIIKEGVESWNLALSLQVLRMRLKLKFNLIQLIGMPEILDIMF